MTRTATVTRTPTWTRTFTSTRTATPTPTITLTPTVTSTPGLGVLDVFYVAENLWSPAAQGPLSIYVEYPYSGGPFSLRVYNSAGEQVRTLFDKVPGVSVAESHQWDGKNEKGEDCASGVYLLVLTEPYDRKVRKIILTR
jgi:flagellar hook assembly protein FlgD